MKVVDTALPGVRLIEPDFHGDLRGGFMETYHAARYPEAGIACRFVQDNVSYSSRGVIRGLHLQHPYGQEKLVQVLLGEVFDVAVDVRVGSPSFGRWIGEILSDVNKRQLFVPKGFAHGFCTLSERSAFQYKCSDRYAPEAEITLQWNDPAIGVAWPVDMPILSAKDQKGLPLAAIPRDRLPVYEA